MLLSDAAGELRFVPIKNVAKAPRTGYVMHPGALLAALGEAERAGGGLWAIVHSHTEAGAHFSGEDKQVALGDGAEPLCASIRYLVVAVHNDAAGEMKLYRWDAAARAFVEEPLDTVSGRTIATKSEEPSGSRLGA